MISPVPISPAWKEFLDLISSSRSGRISSKALIGVFGGKPQSLFACSIMSTKRSCERASRLPVYCSLSVTGSNVLKNRRMWSFVRGGKAVLGFDRSCQRTEREWS